jgi:hypothetical protein
MLLLFQRRLRSAARPAFRSLLAPTQLPHLKLRLFASKSSVSELTIDSQLSLFPKVGKARAEKLSALNLKNARDLLNYQDKVHNDPVIGGLRLSKVRV